MSLTERGGVLFWQLAAVALVAAVLWFAKVCMGAQIEQVIEAIQQGRPW